MKMLPITSIDADARRRTRGLRRGSVLLLSLVLSAIAGITVGMVTSYYVRSARLARFYQQQTAERFAGEHAIETVMADISGMVIDPISSQGEQLAGKATSFEQLKSELSKIGQSITMDVGGYQVDTTLDVSELDHAVDIDGDGRIGDDEADIRPLTVDAVVRSPHGGLQAKHVRQVLQVELVRIGKEVQSSMPVFDYVYFANNFGHLESKGIIANGNVGSNDRFTIDGATVNGYVRVHGNSKGDPAAVTLENGEGQPPKIWPYVTYMKRVTAACKIGSNDFYTQVRPTDPNHGVTNGTKVAIEWVGGYAYPGGSDDYGTIGDDGIYIPSENPYATEEPQWEGGDCPEALDPATYPADYSEEKPTPPKDWTGGTRPELVPKTRPEDWSVNHPYPEGSEPTKVDDPGANPLDKFWADMPLINSSNKSRSDYYIGLGVYVFLYDDYVTDNQAWANSTVGKSWSTPIPNVKNSTYYRFSSVKAVHFKDQDYETALNNWAAQAKAHPTWSSSYKTWKKQDDKYQQYLKDLKAWQDIEKEQKQWKKDNEKREAEQSAWDTQKAKQIKYDEDRAAWQTQYDKDLAQYKIDLAAWEQGDAAVKQQQSDWRTRNSTRNQEISAWNEDHSAWETEHNKWQSDYDGFNDNQREMANQVNNGYYKLDLTKDLMTQHAYWNEDGSAKEQQYIIQVTTNYVVMPNVSDDTLYRNYCRTNEVIITNAFGVAVRQKGGSLTCKNIYQKVTADGSSDLPIYWTYDYQKKKRGVCDISLIGDVGKEITVKYEGDAQLSRQLTSVDFTGGYWGDSYNYPFTDKACVNAEKGSVVLIGTAKYPITINGPVYFDGDVLIRGFVSGQGTIYAGRNIHIISDITYLNPPSWPHANTDQEQNSPHVVAENNRTRDLLLLMARGNIVVGDYTKDEWKNCLNKWIGRVNDDGGESAENICNQMDDSEIGYPASLVGFNRKYAGLENGSNGWDGGYKADLGWKSTPDDVDSGKLGDENYWSGGYHVKWEIYTMTPTESKGALRHYESKLGDTVLTQLMQSRSSSSSVGWSSSILQRLFWRWGGYNNTSVNTGQTQVDYTQTSSAIASDQEAGDITRIDASLFANHGIFGLVGGSVTKKFTLNGGLVCRDEGLLPTLKERIEGAEVWLNYDLRLRSDSAEGNAVVAPSLSRKSAARTELKVSVKSFQQL